MHAHARDNRMIDFLLPVDVSLLGRSHVLSVKADRAIPTRPRRSPTRWPRPISTTSAATRSRSMDRVDKFLLARVAELREQVRKSDQAVEDYRRSHGLYKSQARRRRTTSS
jgi:uncharacterized protein involved in exopolysaccharide biosynthesis